MSTPKTQRTPRNGAQLEVLPDQTALSHRVAEMIALAARDAVVRSGRFTIALSGGPAPGPVFELLADEGQPYRRDMPWNDVYFFWGDERHVPPSHRDSNYRLAYETMLSKVPVPEENVHRIRAELADAAEAAELYEATLRQFFKPAIGGFPRFNLMLQGLGANGHTASLFPGTSALTEHRRAVVATWVEILQAHRITVTYPVLNNAAIALFVVSGEETADALNQVLFGPRFSTPLPAQLVAPTSGRLVWLADQEAASRLAA